MLILKTQKNSPLINEHGLCLSIYLQQLIRPPSLALAAASGLTTAVLLITLVSYELQ